jgi:LacI family transcriptional regulator, gluconate utilization system Gnt-I transcriptional repressor
MQTLTPELEGADYELVLGQTGYDHEREAALIETLGRCATALW